MPHAETLAAGTRAKVMQTIRWRDRLWQREVVGTVVSCSRQPTGSWFVHGENGRLWLHRLQLRKDDGEVTDLVLDPNSTVIVLKPTT
jgi:hypothetical protein